jgi:hypothetical protein
LSVNHIYLPSTGAHQWQWLLASPGLQWKHAASAMALADAWEEADGFPRLVAESLDVDPDLAGLQLLLGVPEHEVPLPGGTRASQTDLFVLARGAEGELVTIAVEGKAKERFGDDTVAEWRRPGGEGRRKRLAHLLDVLALSDDERLAPIRYQLLHRTASAVIEARRFGARHAVMLVHSFPQGEDWFGDFAAFAALYGVAITRDTTVPAYAFADLKLHLGWVSDHPRPAAHAPALGPRFDRALAFARELHSEQVRKGTEIPYIAHLLGVTSLVLEDGGSENEAIAALLHDAVEDQGGQPTLGRIRQLFGSQVADIVQACSDTDVIPKPAWRERKEAYLAHLQQSLPAGTVRVSLADKVHNARAILFDLNSGHDVFARFSAGRGEQLWYYKALASTFAEVTDSPMVRELQRTINAITNQGPPTQDTTSGG